METTIYNKEGKQSGKVKLPEQVFGLPWNVDLVKQVVVSMQANARTPVAHTKDRSDVRGGGKKPWRQKGTGRARHGSIRSPLWRGGGVTFGPRNEKNYTKKINKKMRTKALYTALSRKFKEGEILFVDSLAFTAPKTKDAQEILTALSKVSGFEQLVTKKKNAALVTLSERDANVEKSFQNIGQVYVGEVRNLNPVDVLTCKYLIITDPTKSLTLLSSRGTSNEVASETKAEEKKTPAKAQKVPAKTKEKVAAAA